ncbi:MAG: DUF2971 domain-containing protein [Thermoguttaceae bacterium]|nr:DUF2971 domain-containing protein [Thermoguttaceae bacterium]
MLYEKLPETLWHYTSIENAVKILTSMTLRASHCYSMNDPGEWIYSLNVVDNFLRAQGDNSKIESTTKLVHKLNETCTNRDCFVVSFCAQKDALSLWRGYCHNGGCAIGFNTQKLREVIEDINSSSLMDLSQWQLRKCLYYNEDGDNNEIQEIISKLTQIFMKSAISEEEIFGANGLLSSELIDLCMLIKHHAYQEEKEWRLFDEPHRGQIHLDSTKPYLEIRFRPRELATFVTEVNLAPNSTQEDRHQIEIAKFQLRNELFRSDPNTNFSPSLFQISQSQLPYRN